MSRIQQLTQNEWDAMLGAIEAAKRERAEKMPTELDALRFMFSAWERLKELGWREAMYAPRDGRTLEFIEAGSTGIHRGHKDEKFTWIHDAGDLWPSNPILFRETTTDAERTKVSSQASGQDRVEPKQEINPSNGDEQP